MGGGRTSWDLNLTNLSSYKIVLLGSSLFTKNRADTAVFSRLLARWACGCSRDAETKGQQAAALSSVVLVGGASYLAEPSANLLLVLGASLVRVGRYWSTVGLVCLN